MAIGFYIATLLRVFKKGSPTLHLFHVNFWQNKDCNEIALPVEQRAKVPNETSQAGKKAGRSQCGYQEALAAWVEQVQHVGIPMNRKSDNEEAIFVNLIRVTQRGFVFADSLPVPRCPL